MKRNIILAVVLLLLSSGILLFVKTGYFSSGGDVHSIVLTQNGFFPSEITINKGDIIVFTTSAGKDFWPASDLHPTHGVYPEFDPKRPLNSGESWSFKFEKVGKWNFHDHLRSNYVGVVEVTDNSQDSRDKCLDDGGKIQCWQELLNKTMEEEGLPKTFDLLAELYSKDQLFATECHSFVHEIGKYAYGKFKVGESFELNSKTSYCGYGFYHGFMETLLQTTGNIKQAQDFCKYVGKKLAGETLDGEGACYHGIGHGAVDGGDPTSWGKPEEMILASLKICKSLAGDDHTQYGKMYRCVSGAYNALEILSMDKKYKLPQIQKDPFYICPSQPEEYRQACYTNMIPALLRLTKNNLVESEKYIEKISDSRGDYFKSPIVSDLYHEFIRLNLNQFEYNKKEGIKQCHSFRDPFRLSCVEGLSGGHMKYGDPDKAYVKGLAFCSTSELKDDERNVCYNSILSRLRIWYSKEKSREICQNVQKEFQKYCN